MFAESRPQAEFIILTSGWAATRHYADTWSMFYRQDEFVGGVYGVRIQVVLEGGCRMGPQRNLPSAPDALITWLTAHPYLDVSDPQPVAVGGYTGLYVEFSVAGPKELGACPGEDDTVGLVHLFLVSQDVFKVLPSTRVGVTVLDIEGRAVTLLIEAGAESFDEFRDEHARPLFESMRFSQP